MFKIRGIRSWNFNVEDVEAAAAFYRDKLGAEETGRPPGAGVVRLRLGEQGIGLFDAKGDRAESNPHHTFSCEGPADPEEMKRELEAGGIGVDSIRLEREGAGYSVYVVDPGGNRLELSVRPS